MDAAFISPENADSKLLGIDTCGPSGSVALAQFSPAGLEVLGQIELEGRSYSETLMAAVTGLLANHRLRLQDIACIVAVRGPGSFTGVRIGLSAVKGIAHGAEIPIVTLSRLEVLAANAGVNAAALDAHRQEIFLRLADRELLAGAAELAEIHPRPSRIAICDEAAASLLSRGWAATEIIRVAAPTAADALRLALVQIAAGDYADLALLDGHYLRRSDAEIFGASSLSS